MNVRVACPTGYDPDGEVMASVKRHAEVSSVLFVASLFLH